MTYNERVDPGKINHPIATAIGVLIMVAVIVVGIVLWVRGSAEEVRIGDTRIGELVPVRDGDSVVSAYPIEATITTESSTALQTRELRVEVLAAVAITSCSAAVFPQAQVEASYNVVLPIDPATGLPALDTARLPIDYEVTAKGQTPVAFTTGPQSQSAGTVVVTVVRPVVVLSDGAELGTKSVAMTTTPELVQEFIDGVHALDPTARQEQDQCAKAELAKIDDMMARSSLETPSLRELRQVYAVLAGEH